MKIWFNMVLSKNILSCIDFISQTIRGKLFLIFKSFYLTCYTMSLFDLINENKKSFLKNKTCFHERAEEI